MPARLIIDKRNGTLYEGFDARRVLSLAECLGAEHGLSPEVEVYLLDTDSTPATVTLSNADLALDVGFAEPPEFTGEVAANFGADSSELFDLSASTLAYALNNLAAVQTAGGVDVTSYEDGYLITASEVGAIASTPTLTTEGVLPHASSETTATRTGDADTRAQWMLRVVPAPVAAIAESGWTVVTDGSYSGLKASLTLSTSSLAASLAAGVRDYELSINHDGERLLRAPLTISQAVDATGAGALTITSPALFTLDGTVIRQGDSATSTGGAGSGINWRGQWVAATNYAEDDGVENNGSSYLALSAGAGNVPGSAGDTQWSLMAQVGGTSQEGRPNWGGNPANTFKDANDVFTLSDYTPASGGSIVSGDGSATLTGAGVKRGNAVYSNGVDIIDGAVSNLNVDVTAADAEFTVFVVGVAAETDEGNVPVIFANSTNTNFSGFYHHPSLGPLFFGTAATSQGTDPGRQLWRTPGAVFTEAVKVSRTGSGTLDWFLPGKKITSTNMFRDVDTMCFGGSSDTSPILADGGGTIYCEIHDSLLTDAEVEAKRRQLQKRFSPSLIPLPSMLVLGQSNITGTSVGTQGTYTPIGNEDQVLFNRATGDDGGIIGAVRTDNGYFGPSMRIATGFATKHGESPVGICEIAVSGAGFAQWVPGGAQHDILKQGVAAFEEDALGLGYEVVWTGAKCMLGEEDALTLVNSTAAPTNIAAYATELRRLTNHPALPIVFGQITWPDATYETEVQDALTAYVASDRHASLVETSDLATVGGGNIHFTPAALLTLGERLEAEGNPVAHIGASAPGGSMTGAEIKAAYEGEADTNAFTDAEKTKLGGVETGATADQTGAEIKAAYEGEADTNPLTDSLLNKLNSIDANHYLAPVANTAALTALAEASLSDKARVYVEGETADYFYDATAGSGDLAPDDQTGGTGWWKKLVASGDSAASIKTKYESNADTNAFTDTEKTKLGGIESGADATDTANVTAAGALMDSELGSGVQGALSFAAGVDGGLAVHSDAQVAAIAANTAKTKASQTETDTGTDDAKFITPLKLKEYSRQTNNQTGTTYTFAIGDVNEVVELNNAAAITATVPTNASVAFPVGTEIEIWQQGAGQVTVAAAGGVTIRSADGNLKLRAQYSGGVLRKRATDEWSLVGDLDA